MPFVATAVSTKRHPEASERVSHGGSCRLISHAAATRPPTTSRPRQQAPRHPGDPPSMELRPCRRCGTKRPGLARVHQRQQLHGPATKRDRVEPAVALGISTELTKRPFRYAGVHAEEILVPIPPRGGHRCHSARSSCHQGLQRDFNPPRRIPVRFRSPGRGATWHLAPCLAHWTEPCRWQDGWPVADG